MSRNLPEAIYPQIDEKYAYLHNFYKEFKEAGHTILDVTVNEITLTSTNGNTHHGNDELIDAEMIPDLPMGLEMINTRGLRKSNQIKWAPSAFKITSGVSMDRLKRWIEESVNMLLHHHKLEMDNVTESSRRRIFKLFSMTTLFRDGSVVKWAIVDKATKDGGMISVPVVTSVGHMRVMHMKVPPMHVIEDFEGAAECNIIRKNVKTMGVCGNSGLPIKC
jgi:hypothetical protein